VNLTFDLLTPKFIVSSPYSVEHLCQFAAKLTLSFSKYHVHKIYNKEMEGEASDQVEKIKPRLQLDNKVLQ